MDREVMQLRDSLSGRYAQMIYNGYWFSPEREALQALIDEAAVRRYRHGQGEALQGQCDRRWKKVRGVALQAGACHL